MSNALFLSEIIVSSGKISDSVVLSNHLETRFFHEISGGYGPDKYLNSVGPSCTIFSVLA